MLSFMVAGPVISLNDLSAILASIIYDKNVDIKIALAAFVIEYHTCAHYAVWKQQSWIYIQY